MIARILITAATLAATTAVAQDPAPFPDRPGPPASSASTVEEGGPGSAGSDADAAALAQATLNPVASLISVPIQNNTDWGAGSSDAGFQYKLTVQPVIPVTLNEEWNLISRTIVPYVYQEDVLGTTSQSGLSDTLQSLFVSPKEPAGGWVWGAGPVLQLPTATDDWLGEEQWGVGPTAVVLKQQGPWTYGALVNHIWSFAGQRSREDVNRTFLQPFATYTTKTLTSIGLNAESTYDWRHSQWTVPMNLFVQQLIKVGHQPIALQFGGRYYAEGPDGAPEWGLRFQVSLLFPKS